jgi:RNA polymerase sigma factor (sigma-70 family)
VTKEIYLHRLQKNEKKFAPLSEYQIQLVLDNEKLIYYLACKFRSKFLTYEDAVAECAYIICRVAKIFKPELNYKFTTIATVAWRRHLGRIGDVYGAPTNGYRISSHWQSVPTDSGYHEDNLKSGYDHIESIAVREEVRRMRNILATLPIKTQEVLASRMDGKTLEKIGEEIGVTRERVRQIEARGIQLARQKLIALEEKK